jgi:hypothetical protein
MVNERMNMLHNSHELHHSTIFLTISIYINTLKILMTLNGKTFNETFNNHDQKIEH